MGFAIGVWGIRAYTVCMNTHANRAHCIYQTVKPMKKDKPMRNALTLAFSTILGAAVATLGHAQEMTFEFVGNGGNCLGCEWIEASGEITADTPAQFAAFADTLRGSGSLALNSPGGDLDAAIALGRMIRARGWGTERREMGSRYGTPAETTVCVSECVLAFMGGVSRDMDGRFELTIDGARGIDWVSPKVLDYTLDMGVSAEVLTIADNVPANATYTFSLDEVDRLGFDNTFVTVDNWHLEPYKDGLVLATKQRFRPSYEVTFTLFCRAEDPRWRILVSYPGDYSGDSYTVETLFDFTRDIAPAAPEFRFGDDAYPVARGDIEFVRNTETGLTASFILPDAVTDYAGQDIWFYPDLARVWGGILDFTIPLPPARWMAVTAENCI